MWWLEDQEPDGIWPEYPFHRPIKQTVATHRPAVIPSEGGAGGEGSKAAR